MQTTMRAVDIYQTRRFSCFFAFILVLWLSIFALVIQVDLDTDDFSNSLKMLQIDFPFKVLQYH